MAAASARSEHGGPASGTCFATAGMTSSRNTTPAPMVSSPSPLVPTLPSVAATIPSAVMYCVP
eukprot:3277687-Rhodomonas_salina.1